MSELKKLREKRKALEKAYKEKEAIRKEEELIEKYRKKNFIEKVFDKIIDLFDRV